MASWASSVPSTTVMARLILGIWMVPTGLPTAGSAMGGATWRAAGGAPRAGAGDGLGRVGVRPSAGPPELLAQHGLVVGGDQTGAPQQVGDEQQDQDAGDQHYPPDCHPDGRERHAGMLPARRTSRPGSPPGGAGPARRARAIDQGCGLAPVRSRAETLVAASIPGLRGPAAPGPDAWSYRVVAVSERVGWRRRTWLIIAAVVVVVLVWARPAGRAGRWSAYRHDQSGLARLEQVKANLTPGQLTSPGSVHLLDAARAEFASAQSDLSSPAVHAR